MSMWNKLLTVDTYGQIRKLTGDDDEQINLFFKFLKERINYKTVVVMAISWKTFSEERQVAIAVEVAGELQASRFIALLDILSEKFLAGKLT